MKDPGNRIPEAYKKDFAEYQHPDTIRRYRPRSAGEGINYLLRESYGPLLLDSLKTALAEAGLTRLRILEFGCGAGMAIQHVAQTIAEEGIELDLAVGADFAPAMIEAAAEETGNLDSAGTLRFVVASNERLAEELADGLGEPLKALAGTFQLAFGINTFRYPIRHGTSSEAVHSLGTLLASGGRVVIIDMNDRFPYGLRPTFGRNGGKSLVSFGTQKLPTLDEYARPLAEGGFEILRKDHFAWIPHSANGLRFRVARAASGVLDILVRDRAMRSLIIARKL